jgi:hypothetical protein
MKIFNVALLEDDMAKLVHVFILDQKRTKEVAMSIHFHINSKVFFLSTALFKVACLIMFNAW